MEKDINYKAVGVLERKIRRYLLMDAHRKMVREGKFIEANTVLYLLRKGKVSLGLGNESFAVESLCEKLGCKIRYSRNFNIAEVRL